MTDKHRRRPLGRASRVQILAHRGASGYRPEHTLEGYELAIAMGADYIEPDLVCTRDGVLVDRHEPEISQTTDVAAHPEFASRWTTKTIDGQQYSGWFTEDFTLGELRQLRAIERIPTLRSQNVAFDGRFHIPTFEEILCLQARLSRRYRRRIGIIPELKHPSYYRGLGLALEPRLCRLLSAFGQNHRRALVWVQCFEPTGLIRLRQRHDCAVRLMLLTDVTGMPADLRERPNGLSYPELHSPAALRRLSAWIDGIGPNKLAVIEQDADGRLRDEPTSLVATAHAAGLAVGPWTFRAENAFLPSDCQQPGGPHAIGRAHLEILAYLAAGIDALFTDHPDLAVEARRKFEQDLDRAEGAAAPGSTGSAPERLMRR